MNEKSSLRTGVIGTLIAALCCFTPVLVIGMGAVGLSAWVGGIDYVVFPVMFASMGLVANALYVRAGRVGPRPIGYIGAAVAAFSILLLWLEFKYALRISIAAAAMVAAYGYYLRAIARKNMDSHTDRDQVNRQ